MNAPNKKTILIKNAEYVVTMDTSNKILQHSSLFIYGNQIQEIDSKKTRADTIIDGRGTIVLPGLINCHHHMFQCGLRGKPELQNQKIARWIAIVCEYAEHMSEELMYYSALANMAELLLYGCTTTTDMLYIFPKGKKNFFEATIAAAKKIGIRFHPYRGSMSVGKKDGALFPDSVVEDPDTIAQDSERVIHLYHDTSPDAMLRIGLAPCTLFTSSSEDYRNATALSKKYGVNLQTHLSESEYENTFSIDTFGKRPVAYLTDLGWLGRKVSFTHCINIDADEIQALSKSHTNVVHCPISNARSPIGEGGLAPVWELLQHHVTVAIGVDGSAGNDSSNVLEELRWARTLQGARRESTYLTPIDTLKMGTIHGAKLLNWENSLGSIETGKLADIAIFSCNAIESAGAAWDPVTSLISTQARRADTVIVNGKIVVQNSHMVKINEENVVSKLHSCDSIS